MDTIKDFITNSALQWTEKAKRDKNSLAGFIVNRIESENKLRDTQIEALKVYLYLKCFAGNQTLLQFFAANYKQDEGVPLKTLLLDIATEINSEKLSRFARTATEQEIYDFFETFFGGYNGIANYLFSLPMGAGKTFVMAAIIYIDLYFNLNQDNSIFAKNFLIFAPSGLKSSVIPSLRTIERFDPSWVLPSDIAQKLKSQLKFHILDENKTKKKSNRTENPNANKVKQALQQSEIYGNVFITNAEKVVLDKIVEDRSHQLQLNLDDEQGKQLNELRHELGKIPALMIIIDEVHHAQKEENKLKFVIKKHFYKGTVNSIIGFTGTPYDKRKIEFNDFSLNLDRITNTVYHYELIKGVRNFLKQPIINSYTSDTATIVNSALSDFYARYYDFEFQDGRKPKLAIYCSNIERLEEEVFPLVTEFYREKNLNPDEILKYYGGDKTSKSGKKYALAKDAEMEFSKLDTSQSKKRIVLLCQIAKEGWDCQSLCGVVLSGGGDSPKNMVLQTSCRCLREVDDAKKEAGLIYLNQDNYRHLDNELQQSHKITIKEFEKGADTKERLLRVDRRKHLKLPDIVFNQFVVEYGASSQKAAEPSVLLEDLVRKIKSKEKPYFLPQIRTVKSGLDMEDKSDVSVSVLENYSNSISFSEFVLLIAKQSFGHICASKIAKHRGVAEIYNLISRAGRIQSGCDLGAIISGIHSAYLPRTEISFSEKIEPRKISWLIDDINKNAIPDGARIYPESRGFIKQIEEYDKSDVSTEKVIAKAKEKIAALDTLAESDPSLKSALTEAIGREKDSKLAMENKEKSFHYIPYDFSGSAFEKEVLESIYGLDFFQNNGLEVYFNGDRFLSTFKIRIYEKTPRGWELVQGSYTPDFLIIRKNKKNEIEKALIIETKGAHLAGGYAKIKKFMENKFLEDNKDRFDYLYLQDDVDGGLRLQKISDKIKQYFN